MGEDRTLQTFRTFDICIQALPALPFLSFFLYTPLHCHPFSFSTCHTCTTTPSFSLSSHLFSLFTPLLLLPFPTLHFTHPLPTFSCFFLHTLHFPFSSNRTRTQTGSPHRNVSQVTRQLKEKLAWLDIFYTFVQSWLPRLLLAHFPKGFSFSPLSILQHAFHYTHRLRDMPIPRSVSFCLLLTCPTLFPIPPPPLLCFAPLPSLLSPLERRQGWSGWAGNRQTGRWKPALLSLSPASLCLPSDLNFLPTFGRGGGEYLPYHLSLYDGIYMKKK